jgi:hypothetical protein
MEASPAYKLECQNRPDGRAGSESREPSIAEESIPRSSFTGFGEKLFALPRGGRAETLERLNEGRRLIVYLVKTIRLSIFFSLDRVDIWTQAQ